MPQEGDKPLWYKPYGDNRRVTSQSQLRGMAWAHGVYKQRHCFAVAARSKSHTKTTQLIEYGCFSCVCLCMSFRSGGKNPGAHKGIGIYAIC